MSWCRPAWVHLVWNPLYQYTLCFRFGKLSTILLQIYFPFPFIFLPVLESLLWVDWLTFYYPTGVLYCFFFFLFFFIWPVCCPDLVISIILSSRSLFCFSELLILLSFICSSCLCKWAFYFFLVPLYSFQFLFTVPCISINSLS